VPRSDHTRVLLIEDNSRLAYSLSRLLAAHAMCIDIATDGQMGLEVARSCCHDVLLVDLILPRKSGLDLLGDLRSEGIRTPAIILTGRGSFESALEAGRLGVFAISRSRRRSLRSLEPSGPPLVN
jgi:two-component system OmpR family response regulator